MNAKMDSHIRLQQAGPRTKDENANTKNCIRVFSMALKRIPHPEGVKKKL